MIKQIIFFLLFFILLFPEQTLGSETSSICQNRYLTLVNPVRSRELWIEKNLDPIAKQYKIINFNQFSATWLLQSDVLNDRELLDYIRKFDENQEFGLFLEVSEDLANQAKVIYPYNLPWFSPSAVFLSAYSQSERKRLIDKSFENFKKEFGIYPKSVGAWWIDSFSLEFLKSKYKISAAMIVADQKTTDQYGVWGQWWGMPYYPSKANILTPASSLSNKQDVVIIQWAQRDPVGTVDEGPKSSNFSLQANDYIRQGRDTKYFEEIVEVYLDCKNILGQITIGLETGQESIGYIGEYEKQLTLLKNKPNLKSLTMSQFSKEFKNVYPEFPKTGVISREDSIWNLNTTSRSNIKYNDEIYYQPEVAFVDYFIADKNDFLDRRLPVKGSKGNLKDKNPIIYWVILGLGFLSVVKKKTIVFFASLLFCFACFGLILKSNTFFGWQVFYGPRLVNLALIQAILLVISFVVFYLIDKYLKNEKIKRYFIWTVSLGFGFDFILQSLRYTVVSKVHYLGFASDNLSVFGINWNDKLSFFAKDFPAYQAAALLRLDFNKYWDNLYFTLIIYPLIHLVLGVVLAFLVMKLPKIVRVNIIGLLVILLVLHLLQIYNADPRAVLP